MVEVMKIMATASKGSMQALLHSVPQTLQQATATHTSPRDCWTLMGKSGSVSCGVTAPFSWVLVRTGFVCALQESVSPVLWKLCNQIPLSSKFTFHKGSQSLCRSPV